MQIALPSLKCYKTNADYPVIIDMLWLRCQLPCHHWKVMKRMQSGLLSYMSIFWIEFWLFCFHRYLFFLNAAFPAFIIMSWTNADCPAFIDMLWMNADYPTINDVLWANVDCPAIIKILWTSEDYPAIIDMKECRLPCNYLDKMSKCGLPCVIDMLWTSANYPAIGFFCHH